MDVVGYVVLLADVEGVEEAADGDGRAGNADQFALDGGDRETEGRGRRGRGLRQGRVFRGFNGIGRGKDHFDGRNDSLGIQQVDRAAEVVVVLGGAGAFGFGSRRRGRL